MAGQGSGSLPETTGQEPCAAWKQGWPKAKTGGPCLPSGDGRRDPRRKMWQARLWEAGKLLVAQWRGEQYRVVHRVWEGPIYRM